VIEPTETEIEAWASRERERRQRWLAGPTPEQAAVLASRAGELESAPPAHRRGEPSARVAQHSLRSAQLAAEGAISLLFRLSLRDAFDRLVQAGRDWEDEFSPPPDS
jgi:hypothetical protein